jgi:hypothetical protein
MRALAMTNLWILRNQEKHISKTPRRFRLYMTQTEETPVFYLINLLCAGEKERRWGGGKRERERERDGEGQRKREKV